MLVSDTHRFVFHHVPKTGGTSMTAALAPLLRDPKPFEGDEHGWQMNHHVGAIHRPIREIRPGSNFPEGYLELAFVRNPFDVVASIWKKLHQPGVRAGTRVPPFFEEPEPFERFVERTMRPGGWRAYKSGIIHIRWTQSDYLGGGRELFFIGRYERLHIDWARMWDRVGLPGDAPPLLRLNQTHDRKPYRSCFVKKRSRDLVEEFYAEDLQRWGYEF